MMKEQFVGRMKEIDPRVWRETQEAVLAGDREKLTELLREDASGLAERMTDYSALRPE